MYESQKDIRGAWDRIVSLNSRNKKTQKVHLLLQLEEHKEHSMSETVAENIVIQQQKAYIVLPLVAKDL